MIHIGSGYIQKQNESVEICKQCKYRKQYIEQRNKANRYDSLVEKIKDNIKSEKEETKHFAKTGEEETTRRHVYTAEILQELLEEVKEEKTDES